MCDYRLVDSYWIPCHIFLSYHGILTMEIELKSIKPNDPIDKGLLMSDLVPTVNLTGKLTQTIVFCQASCKNIPTMIMVKWKWKIYLQSVS